MKRFDCLEFLGGVGTVTGSRSFLHFGDKRIMIDCGLFQGLKSLRLRNREEPNFDPAEIDALLLTHAHLDHVGYIPLLTKNGFRGPIYCTEPTAALAEVVLMDSARIKEEEAERANKNRYSRHSPAVPLYTVKDVESALKQFSPMGAYDEWFHLFEEVHFRFSNAGHIPGSSLLQLNDGTIDVVFSGDLGRTSPLLLPPPAHIKKADYLILESTYGDRLHPDQSPEAALEKVIKQTHGRGGHLIIPAFAIERAQEVLFIINKLKREQKIPKIPVYLDSPMGIRATEVFLKYGAWHNLSPKKCQEIVQDVTPIREFRDTLKVLDLKEPAIFLAGSGMLSGGRVLHYLERFMGDPKHSIVLVGFQAPGTRGRQLDEGNHEIKFFGGYHKVRAQVHKVGELSAHADQNEILEWLSHFEKPPRKVFLNHGDPMAAEALALKIRTELKWKVTVAGEKRYNFPPVT